MYAFSIIVFRTPQSHDVFLCPALEVLQRSLLAGPKVDAYSILEESNARAPRAGEVDDPDDVRLQALVVRPILGDDLLVADRHHSRSQLGFLPSSTHSSDLIQS